MTKITQKDILQGNAYRVIRNGKKAWMVVQPCETVPDGAIKVEQTTLPHSTGSELFVGKPKQPRRSAKANGHGEYLNNRRVRVRSLDNNKLLEGEYIWIGGSTSDFGILIDKDKRSVFDKFSLPKRNWVVSWYERDD